MRFAGICQPSKADVPSSPLLFIFRLLIFNHLQPSTNLSTHPSSSREPSPQVELTIKLLPCAPWLCSSGAHLVRYGSEIGEDSLLVWERNVHFRWWSCFVALFVAGDQSKYITPRSLLQSCTSFPSSTQTFLSSRIISSDCNQIWFHPVPSNGRKEQKRKESSYCNGRTREIHTLPFPNTFTISSVRNTHRTS